MLYLHMYVYVFTELIMVQSLYLNGGVGKEILLKLIFFFKKHCHIV